MWQLFHPFSLCFIQLLFQLVKYDLVDRFDLPVPLWIHRGGISIGYAQIIAIPPKGLAIKLQSVIRDKRMRDPKPSDNILLNEFLSIRISNICQRLNFNPLCEVICADQWKSLIPYRVREGTHNVRYPQCPVPIEQKAKGWTVG